tara:strand:- start:2095 stop:2697 length:603 start_codon:yes stop_codon:yes gene_type:complete
MTKIEDAIINSFNKESGSLFKGDVYEKLDKHGNVRLSWDYYLNDQGKKVKHGKQTNFYKDGSVQFSGEWKDGKKVGKWNKYREDGTIEESWSYNSEGKTIDKVIYDDKGAPRNLDKERMDSEWSRRTNYFNDGLTGSRIDLHRFSDNDLNKNYQNHLRTIAQIKSGQSTLSSASIPYFESLANAFQGEIQIRKDAGRWRK